MWVKHISLQPLVEVESFQLLRLFATLLWVFTIVLTIISLTRSALGNVHRTAILGIALTIAVGVLMPENIKEHIGSSLFHALARQSAPTVDATTFKLTPLLPELDIYKAGHFVMFVMLASVAFYHRPYPISRAQMFGYLLLFALVTEVLQLFVAGRSAQLGDVLIDSEGIFTGWILSYISRVFRPAFR